MFYWYQPRGLGDKELPAHMQERNPLAIEPCAEGWERDTQPMGYPYILYILNALGFYSKLIYVTSTDWQKEKVVQWRWTPSNR